MPSMPTAIEEPSLRLTVDELILDYLLWHCTQTLLEERRQLRGNPNTSLRDGDVAIKLAHKFYHTFTAKHPAFALPEPLLIRLRQCVFTIALLRRAHLTTPDFSAPTTQSARAARWLRHKGSPIVQLSNPALLRNRASSLQPQSPRPQNAVFGDLTLRDVTWEFMTLSAHIAARVAEVSGTWLQTATELMTHAAVEAYLVGHATAQEAIDQAFSYGLVEMDNPLENIADMVVNELFADADGDVARECERLKESVLGRFRNARTAQELEQIFVGLSGEMDFGEFVGGLVEGFLAPVSQAQSRPALAQLEQGKLEGFREEDIRAVLRDAGVAEDVWAGGRA